MAAAQKENRDFREVADQIENRRREAEEASQQAKDSIARTASTQTGIFLTLYLKLLP